MPESRQKEKLSACLQSKGRVASSSAEPTNKSYNELIKVMMLVKKTKSPSKLYKVLEELNEHKNIVSDLMRSFLFLKLNNKYRGDREMIKIMQKDFLYHSLTSDFSLTEISKQGELTVKVLKEIETLSEDKMIFKMFLFYLHQHSSGDFKNLIDRSFEVDKKMSFIREMYQSNQLAKKLPFVWASSLFELSSLEEFKKFIELSYIIDELKADNYSMLIFFEHLDSVPRDMKQVVINKFTDFEAKKKTFYEEAIYLRLISSPTFYQFLHSKTKKRYGLISTKQRKFYLEMLAKDQAINYSVFELLSLGDMDSSYLTKVRATYVGL